MHCVSEGSFSLQRRPCTRLLSTQRVSLYAWESDDGMSLCNVGFSVQRDFVLANGCCLSEGGLSLQGVSFAQVLTKGQLQEGLS
eukprot:4379627-Amphidinium_carterae.1